MTETDPWPDGATTIRRCWGRAAAGVLMGVVVSACATASPAFVVTGHTWERTVSVEERRPVSHTAGHEAVPAEEWSIVASKARKGNGTDATWPEVTYASGQREGIPAERYVVNIQDPAGAAHDCEVSEDRWLAMADRTRWNAPAGAPADAAACGTFIRAR